MKNRRPDGIRFQSAVDHSLIQLEETAREVVAKLDTRIRLLDGHVRAADKASTRLEDLLAKAAELHPGSAAGPAQNVTVVSDPEPAPARRSELEEQLAASPEAGEESPAASPEAGDESSAASPEAGEESLAASLETGDESPAASPETGDESPAASLETGDESSAASPEAGDKAPAATPEPVAEPQPSERSLRVHELADEGTSDLDIARKIGLPVGEVKLIMRLRDASRLTTLGEDSPSEDPL